MKAVRLFLIISVLSMPHLSAAGQQPSSPAAATPAPTASAPSVPITPADLSTPESPAFTVLGLTPDKVTRPATIAAFAAAAVNGVDDHGKIQNGVAIDVNPVRAFAGKRLTLENYSVLARTSVSLATTQESSGDAGHVAFGIHTAIFDLGDARSDEVLIKCFQDVLKDFDVEPTLDGQVEDVKDLAEPAANCRKKAASSGWNRSAWIVAGAPAWISSDATLQKLKSDGGGLWTSLSWGFEKLCPDPDNCTGWRGDLYKHAQIMIHARGRNNEHVTDKDKVTTDHDRRMFGARLRVGAENVSGSLEVTRESDRTSTERTRRNAFVLAFEPRLADGVWLNISLGREQKIGTGSGMVARSSFHWQINPKKSVQ